MGAFLRAEILRSVLVSACFTTIGASCMANADDMRCYECRKWPLQTLKEMLHVQPIWIISNNEERDMASDIEGNDKRSGLLPEEKKG